MNFSSSRLFCPLSVVFFVEQIVDQRLDSNVPYYIFDSGVFSPDEKTFVDTLTSTFNNCVFFFSSLKLTFRAHDQF